MSRRAVVTGGLSGLGAACAERLAEDGVEVLTLDVAAGADIVVNVTDYDAVSAAARSAGPVDILVNSAGIVGPTDKPLWEVETAEWERTFAINVTGIFNTCRAFVPGMRERGWGRVVNIASVAGKEGNPMMSPYSASKAAVIGLTKSLGKELATDGVLVNAIAPALFATPMNDDESEESLEYMLRAIPMGRPGQPVEVAELVAWLTSEKVSFSTGAVYDISGGRATY